MAEPFSLQALALLTLCNSLPGSEGRWDADRARGIDDAALAGRILEEFGTGPVTRAGDGWEAAGYGKRGGHDGRRKDVPRFWFGTRSWWDHSPTLEGPGLVARVRVVLDLPYPPGHQMTMQLGLFGDEPSWPEGMAH